MPIRERTRKIHRFVRKVFTRLHDRAMGPATEEEERLVAELRKTFSELPESTSENPETTEHQWLENISRLRQAVQRRDPREFLRWHVVSASMSAKYPQYADAEFDYLKALVDWKSRWRLAIQESPVGHPVPYYRHPGSSANLIHQAYHVARFEQELHDDLTRAPLILEFGGGYGCMCRLLHKLGYSGCHVIFDLPEFSELQRFYLRSVGLPLRHADRLKAREQGIYCISDLDVLKDLLCQSPPGPGAAFIATWSISETPLQLRNVIVPLVSTFDRFLIAYQHRFAQIDNMAWFQDWRNTIGDVEWHHCEISHMRGSSYMMGTVRRKR